jgi:hypothetical protein
MIGRGHPAGPCPTLSYVERVISVLAFFFKKKNKKINLILKPASSSSILIFCPKTIFPPNLSLPLSISSPQPTTKSTTSPPPSTTHEPATETSLCVLHLRPKVTVRSLSLVRLRRIRQPNHRTATSSPSRTTAAADEPIHRKVFLVFFFYLSF